MMRFLVLFFLFFALPCYAGVQTVYVTLPDGIEKPRESHYRDALAKALKDKGETVRTEVVCKGGRADIVTATHAIEVDRAKKWHESIGQACHYALVLGLKPTIALFRISDIPPDQFDALKRLTARRKIDVIIISVTPPARR